MPDECFGIRVSLFLKGSSAKSNPQGVFSRFRAASLYTPVSRSGPGMKPKSAGPSRRTAPELIRRNFKRSNLMTMIRKTLLTLALTAASGAALALPNIAVLATGGTIAGAGASSTGSAYEAGKVSVNHLVAAVPELAKVANVTPVQVTNIGSQDMSDEVWLKLAKTINADCGKYDGFVITHGTDTMEETAYFLQLTSKCKKPVVMVGAMLPSTGLSADGPRNLFHAVITAAEPKTADYGVVVAMNNVIVGARDVIKTNTVQPETFQGANFGKLGTIFNNKVEYEMMPLRKHTTETPFDVSKLDKLPKVGIVYNHAGVEGVQAGALVKAGYQGIVNAGVGNGNIHKSVWPILEKAAKDGIVVVRSSRVPTGATTKDAEVDDKKMGWVASGSLNPQKARVLLQLALTKTTDWTEVQKYFDQY